MCKGLNRISSFVQGTGYIASGRIGRDEDHDDVYDDGRTYEYKPRQISLDEMLSVSEHSAGEAPAHLNNNGSSYLDRSLVTEVWLVHVSRTFSSRYCVFQCGCESQ